MLQFIRSRAAGFVAKTIAFLLVAGFAAWEFGSGYLGDTLNPQQAIALTVGERSFQVYDVDLRFREMVANARRNGEALTDREARAQGMVEQAMDSLIDEELYKQAARSMGLNVPMAVIEANLAATPGFRDSEGRFDYERFQATLRSEGLTERAFVEDTKDQIAVNTWSSAVLGGLSAPQTALDALYQSTNQRRSFGVVTIRPEMLEEVAELTDEELKTFYDQNITRFQTRETRDLSVILLRAEDLEDQVEISDDRVRRTYEREIAAYRQPLRRTVSQVVFTSQADAIAARHVVEDGTSLEEAAGEGLFSDLGEVTEEEFLIPEMAEQVFALEVGQPSEPLESDFGWHIFVVTEEIAESTRPLEEVADDIRERLAQTELADLLYERSLELEDEFNGGSTIAEAADVLSLPLRKLEQGTSQASFATTEALEGLPASLLQRIAREGFRLSEVGTASQVIELDDGAGYLAVSLDKINERTPRPFEEVKEQAKALADARRLSDRLKAAADALAEEARAEGAAPLQELAEAKGYLYATTEPVLRRGSPETAELPRRVLEDLFEASVGDIVSGASAINGSVAELLELAAPEEPKPEDLMGVRNLIRRDMSEAMLQAMTADLRETFGITRNMNAMNAFYDRNEELLDPTQ